MEKCLKHFEGVDRTIEGFEGLEAAQNCINTDDKTRCICQRLFLFK